MPMDDFSLKWRFIDPKYDQIPLQHLEQLEPLDRDASKFLWDYIKEANVHGDVPFLKGFFRTIDKIEISSDNEIEIKKWLCRRGMPFEKKVMLSWTPTEAMIVPWKLLIKYFDSFYYRGADDLTVIDQSLNWALMFYHEDEIYFGTNHDFLSDNSNEESFIW